MIALYLLHFTLYAPRLGSDHNTNYIEGILRRLSTVDIEDMAPIISKQSFGSWLADLIVVVEVILRLRTYTYFYFYTSI